MIVILTQCFPSRVGGIETLISNLSINLSKKNKVVVFADQHNFFLDNKYDNEVKEHFLVRRTRGIKFFRRRKKINDFKQLIKYEKIKCVIADSWKSFELCIDLLNDKNIPTICLVHGNEVIQKKQNKIKKITNILNKCSSIVTNSNYTSDLVKNLKINKPILKKIYPAAHNLESINGDTKNIIEGKPIILTLSRLEKRKGHINVLNCIQKLKEEFKEIKYIIAGEGPELNFLKKQTKIKQLDKNVVFLGQVDDNQKKYIFSITDLMVMPTTDETKNRSIEGFGIVYIESAFFGIPSIASNIGGTSEAVIHNETGIIVNNIKDLEISLKDLLKDENKRVKLGRKAKERALKQFQWEHVTKEYDSLIAQITNI